MLRPDQLHRLEGILVYFIFLLLLFVISEKMGSGKTTNRLRHFFFPLLVYYATVLGIPLANGGYRQGANFWEHAVFVMLVPLLLMLPFALFCWSSKRLHPDADLDKTAQVGPTLRHP